MRRHPALIRAQAAQACVDRFSGRALKWGTVDCGKIALHNLRQLGISTAAWKRPGTPEVALRAAFQSMNTAKAPITNDQKTESMLM